MTQSYRTNDGSRWGSGIGRALTWPEMDINFWDIIQRIVTLEGNPIASAGIDHFTVSGSSFYVVLTDSTVLGPYVLPTTQFNWRGTWAPTTAYQVNDLFTINGGLYDVIFAHTSASSFSPTANDGMGHDFYATWFQSPGNALPSGGATGQVLKKSSSTDYAVTWGNEFPSGTARQVLIKHSSTADDVIFGAVDASEVTFTAATGTGLTATNVRDALDELAGGGGGLPASGVAYTPPTGSLLAADTNVQDAIDQLETLVPVGRQTLWIPAASMTPRLTNGPALGDIETSVYKTMVKTLDFDSLTSEFAQFEVAMPRAWDPSTNFTAQFVWSHSTGGSTFGVAWTMDCMQLADGTGFDTPCSTPVTVTDTGGTSDASYISTESSGFNPGGGAAADRLTIFRVYRSVSNGADTLNIDARLLGIKLFYVTNAATDA